MTCGFRLRVNESWVDLEDVQSGVQVQSDRSGSEFTSVGGVRHVQYAPKRARSWNLDFGHAGPESVRALVLAAGGQSGDVWLFDEAAARQNLMPDSAIGDARNQIVIVDGLPVRSITSGSPPPSAPVRIDAGSGAGVTSTDAVTQAVNVGASADGLLRFWLPDNPAGWSITSASLVFEAAGVTSGGIEVFSTSNGWATPADPAGLTAAGLWAATRGGVSLGTATVSADGTSTVSLSGVNAFAGLALSVRVARSSGSSAVLRVDDARLMLTYSRTGLTTDKVFEFRLPPVPITMAAWSDYAGGANWGYLSIDGGPEAGLGMPAGSGLRRVSVTLPATEGVCRLRIPDSAGVIAGACISTVDHGGYFPPQNACVKVAVDDPSLVLDQLFAGEHGRGPRSVTLREVG